MNKRALLLDSNYKMLSFISERKIYKLLYKEKVSPISFWDDEIVWNNDKIKLPAILVLKTEVKYRIGMMNFSRYLLIKRDGNCCQYCGVKLIKSQITVDHIIPKSRSGATSYTNCVIACHKCNNYKGDCTPAEAGMRLLRQPIHPVFSSGYYISENQEYWHDDWSNFFKS